MLLNENSISMATGCPPKVYAYENALRIIICLESRFLEKAVTCHLSTYFFITPEFSVCDPFLELYDFFAFSKVML